MNDQVEVGIVDQVEATYTQGCWEFICSWPHKGRLGGIDTVMRIRDLSENPPRLVLSSTKINLLSTSGKDGVGRAMRNRGAGAEATELIHDIAEDLLTHFRQGGHATTPTPRQRQGDSHLLYPIWPSTGGTLVAAGTNSFKSLLALAVALQTTTGHDILGGNTRQPTDPKPVLYCDWEGDENAFAERLYGICQGAGLPLEPSVVYRQMTTPLTDTADTLKDEIGRHGYAGVIIDSLSAAIGGSLNEDEPANMFWNAVTRLGVPVLVTAHKNKEALRRGHKDTFGSVMHENRSRMFWDAFRDPESPLVKWEVISDNNTGRKGDKLAWRVDIANTGEHQQRRLEQVQFTAVNPNDVRQAPNEGDTLADRIAYTLTEHGPLTSGEIATATGHTQHSIRAQLSRHKNLFTKRDDTRFELQK